MLRRVTRLHDSVVNEEAATKFFASSPQTLTEVLASPQPFHVFRKAISYTPEELRVVHLLAMCELVHHHHLYKLE